jgi:5,10-methylene-tetrahydrofolate dehydrogenase/methenyl tetrahydrofolate cyclohydrolase
MFTGQLIEAGTKVLEKNPRIKQTDFCSNSINIAVGKRKNKKPDRLVCNVNPDNSSNNNKAILRVKKSKTE